MTRLESLADIRNSDGTLGMQNDIKGEVLNHVKFGTINLYHVKKFCPWCPKGVEQPVEQVIVFKGQNNLNYHCQACCVEYFYYQDKVYKMRPETEFIAQGFEVLEPNRKPFELHYMEAVESKWFQDIDYSEPKLFDGIWTMGTEVCAQMFHKAMRGHAPGYFMGTSLLNEEQVKITAEHQEVFQAAYKHLQELNYF